MKLLNILFPVHIALRLTDDEVGALKTRADAYLDTTLPNAAERATLTRMRSALAEIQHDRMAGAGLDVQFSARFVHDLALLASPVLNWAAPLPDSFFIHLSLLVNSVPIDIPQSEEQAEHLKVFSAQLEASSSDPEYVASVLTEMEIQAAKLSPAEQQRPRRLKITISDQPSEPVEVPTAEHPGHNRTVRVS